MPNNASQDHRSDSRWQAAESLLNTLKQSLESPSGRLNTNVQAFLSRQRDRFDEGRLEGTARSATVRGQLAVEDPLFTSESGSTFVACDISLERAVAMKVLTPNEQKDETRLSRFLVEAQVAGQLEHANIPPIYRMGVTSEGTLFYITKLIQGRTLDEVLTELRLGRLETVRDYPLNELLVALQKVCDAVAYAHSRRIAHADLRPANIMLGDYGEVLVLAWGRAGKIPRALESGQPAGQTVSNEAAGLGAVPSGSDTEADPFAAPEARSSPAGHWTRQSDVFSLGAILFNILTLRPRPQGEERIHSDSGTPTSRTGAGKGPPQPLLAIARKAMDSRPSERYACVEDFQRDLAAYQDGFAVSAEQAGLWRKSILLFKRRKTEFGLVAITLLIMLGLAFGFTLKTMAHLRGIRQAAPSLYSQAASLVEERRLPEALERIDYALQMEPDRADFHVLRGNILQTSLRIDEAHASYSKALDLVPAHPGARRNLEICNRMRAQSESGISSVALDDFRVELLSQGRYGEAIEVALHIDDSDGTLFQKWQSNALAAGIKRPLLKETNALLSLDLSASGISDLSPLKTLPLTSLNLNSNQISNLDALRGMPLHQLRLIKTAVTNLAPLRGMPLQSLFIAQTPISDISALRGMKLLSLHLGGSLVTDLSPLSGMPLASLTMWRAPIVDLSPLHSTVLTNLNCDDAMITDLRPLTGLPIRTLRLVGCSFVTDLSPLLECRQLEFVAVPQTAKNVEVLRKHPTLQRLTYNRVFRDNSWTDVPVVDDFFRYHFTGNLSAQ
ncbi:MAG: protein kinase [Verrucomicrobiota bacterium]